jgi:hypothetical protein
VNASTLETGLTQLAPMLNAQCQCVWLDRERLRSRLQQTLGDSGRLLESQPGLISGSVVFVDSVSAAAMDRTIRLVQRVLASAACRRKVAAHAPPIGQIAANPWHTNLLGFDFHLGAVDPQLIEINTNPGGLLVNLELARAVTACCDCMTQPIADLVSGEVPLERVPECIADSYSDSWRHVRASTPLQTVAIVDDDPANQYLYPEFLLYQRLFERQGWRAPIVDAAALVVRDGLLLSVDRPIDLVYNRLTDFYLAEPRHDPLRQAHESGIVVVTPDPAAHAHCADKGLLVLLRDESILRDAGLDAPDRAHLLRTIPPTEVVEPAAAADLWRRRKQLFFKPVDGYGSKAAYRGDKLTRTVFEHILAHRYVAQQIAPTSTRRVVTTDGESDLRVDVRNYSYHGTTWLRAARLYRGQATNFRTPGGGFAPVLTLRE